MPKKFYETVKKSSILLLIGVVRLILVTVTNYKYSYSEYGLHWNFFFTVFFVKILSCPLTIITRKSSIRSFFMSMTIGISYQILLSRNNSNLTKILLNNDFNEGVTIIQQNKEGIIFDKDFNE